VEFGLVGDLLAQTRHNLLPAVDGVAAECLAPLFEFVPLVLAHVLSLHVARDRDRHQLGRVHADLSHERLDAIIGHASLSVLVDLLEPLEELLGDLFVEGLAAGRGGSGRWLVQRDSIREKVINSLVDIPSALGEYIDELVFVAWGRRDRVRELLQLPFLLQRQSRQFC